jgi:hypothetical protein
MIFKKNKFKGLSRTADFFYTPGDAGLFAGNG